MLPDVTGTDAPAILTDSVISIRSLLDYVNRYFPDVLPESVLRHYNHDRRPEGKLGENALYQLRDDVRTDRDVLSDAADGDAANVRETVTGVGCSAIWTDRPTGEKTFLTEAAKENAADHGGVQHSDCQTLGGLGRDFQESVSASKRRKISAV